MHSSVPIYYGTFTYIINIIIHLTQFSLVLHNSFQVRKTVPHLGGGGGGGGGGISKVCLCLISICRLIHL